MKITAITACELIDSRATPTVSATVHLEDGSQGFAIVPSGASTGEGEAVELRDHDEKRFNGKGVLTAIRNVTDIIFPALRGMDAENQRAIDEKMIALDGTENKSKLGANAMLAVSLATARAEASAEKKPLYSYLTKFNPDFTGQYLFPLPQMNVINGGKHANWATDIQEFMILPRGATTFPQAVQMGVETYMALKGLLKEKNYSILVGDEGGFAPAVSSNEEPFAILVEAITRAGYTPGKDISLGIDAAASEFTENGSYLMKKEGKTVTSQELSLWYTDKIARYPIISLEDPFSEHDWDAYTAFTKEKGIVTQIIGDDLYVTNVKLLQKGIETHATNTILIKLNQIGTLSETVDAILLARKNGFGSVVSHRSGETEDTFIADFVVAMGTGQIKTGAPARTERAAKYNRLLTIYQDVMHASSLAHFPFQ